jgi:hypothetical protein
MHRSGPVRPKHTPAARLRQCDKQFWSARQAIAATEFALVLPILVILMLGSVEAARLIISAQRVTQVATTIVEMLSQTQAQNPNETGTGIPWSVTYLDLDFAIESTMVIFPQILQDAAQKGISWSNDISISMAGVLFTPNPTTCTSNCSYIANVVWNSGPNTRTCGVALTAVPDTSVPSKTTLPTDVFPTGAPPGGRSSSSIFSTTTRRFLDLASSERFLSRVPLISRPAMCNPAPPPGYIQYYTASGDDGIGAECPKYLPLIK